MADSQLVFEQILRAIYPIYYLIYLYLSNKRRAIEIVDNYITKDGHYLQTKYLLYENQ